jgi:uncharacterized protein YggE
MLTVLQEKARLRQMGKSFRDGIARNTPGVALAVMSGAGTALPALCQDASASASIVPIGTLVQPRTVTTSGTFGVEVPQDQVVVLLGIKTSHSDFTQAKN